MTGIGTTKQAAWFFDVELLIPGRLLDLRSYLERRVVAHIEGMTDEGIYEGKGGFLRLDRISTQQTLFKLSVGRKPWNYPFDEIVQAKLDLAEALPAGVSSRSAQSVHTTFLHGGDTIYFGTYEEEDIRVAYSGEEDFCDECIGRITFAHYKVYVDRQVRYLKRVAQALDLDWHDSAMTVIERYAHELNLHGRPAVRRTLGDVVELIEQCARIKRARADIAQIERNGDPEMLNNMLRVLDTVVQDLPAHEGRNASDG